MLIAIDIDAVLADFLSKFLEYRNKVYQTNFKRNDFYTYVWAEVFKESKEEMYAILSDFFESGYVNQIALISGAKKGIEELKKQGHTIDIVTSRPRFIKDLTLGWLKKNFGDSFKMVYFSNQPAYGSFGSTKGEICHQIKADLFIDDQLVYCKECIKENIKVFLFNNPWNKNIEIPKEITRVFSWAEIIKLTRDL